VDPDPDSDPDPQHCFLVRTDTLGIFLHFHYGFMASNYVFAELYLNYMITVLIVGSYSKAAGLGRHGARTSDGSAETDIQVDTIFISLVYLFTWCVVPHGPGRAFPGNVQYRIRQLSHLAAWSI
jgi:hypothetical protein